MASKFAPKTTFFIKVFSFVFLVPEKRIIFAKVQRRIKSKIRLSYRLSFKLLVVNQSNMLRRIIVKRLKVVIIIINGVIETIRSEQIIIFRKEYCTVVERINNTLL